MKNNLPTGWAAVKLGSIVQELNSGFACGVHNSTGDGIAHLRPMNVTSKGTISLKDLRSVSATSYDKLVKGDVLFNNTNSAELVGKTAYVSEDTDWGYSNHMTRLRFDSEMINSKFVSHYLHSLFHEGFFKANCNNHVSQASISAKFLANEISVPLPPLAEQHRIVAQLDATMQKLEASQERLEKLPALLKKFRQAVLAAAVSGKLTEAWRAEQQALELAADVLESVQHDRFSQARTPRAKAALEEIFDIVEDGQHFELPDTWQFVALDKLAASFNYGTSAKSENAGAVPVLRMGNLQGGQLDWSDLKYTSTPEEIEQYNLVAGDVLFNRTNSPELVGKTAIYRGEQPAIFAGYLIRIKTTPALNSEYLNYCLNSTYARQYCWNVKTDGVSQSNINAQKLSRFEVPFCSLPEQEEIVRQVNHYFELADQLEARFEQAAAMVEQLPQALLAKAFTGQLVAQDPNDEPASELLARLGSSMAAPVKSNRGRKPKAASETPLFA